MIAYFFPKTTRKPSQLVILPDACTGTDFQNGEKISNLTRREAREYCKRLAITPRNF